MDYKTFETERLILRPTQENDAEFIFQLLNSPKWLAYIGDRNIHSVEDAKDYINQKMVSQLQRLGFSNYTLITKEDNHKIGTCGLNDREGLDGIDIGFAFLPAYEKKGYAYEAAKKLVEVAFDVFDIKTLKGITAKNNTSSQKLLEKLGLQLKGKIILPKSNEELLLYQIDKEIAQ